MLDNVIVPDTDIFDVPDLQSYAQVKTVRISRKRVAISLFAKKSTYKSKTSRSVKKNKRNKKKPQRPRKKLKDSEIDRIAVPTHTFLMHTKSENVEMCKKYDKEKPKSTIYRSWWRQTTRHILSLKRTLVKQKVSPITQSRNSNVKSVVNSFWKHMPRVDEAVKLNNLKTRIPIFPKLRLKRETWVEKTKIPLSVTTVEFPLRCVFFESISS
ncbi:hypothetical protein JTB14_015475 [Gonioctena quinquepunctata]|nr:hypothetical protein JTB14_015475 [Gonioctena quinquepunctata]